MVLIVGSLSFSASLFLNLRYSSPYVLAFPEKSRSLSCRLWSVMYVWSLVAGSFVIGSGGLGLHPLVILAVMVFWSGWMLLTWSPFSPTISTGLSPVCADMSSLIDISNLADEMSIKIFS
jgi:hypothetical protein